MGWYAPVTSGGHSGGSEERKADFTVVIALCRLNLLSLFPPWRVEKKQSCCAEIVQKHTSYVGTASSGSGAFKAEKSVQGMAAVLITYGVLHYWSPMT